MECFHFKAQSSGNSDEPTDQNLSHEGIDVSLPFHVVFWYNGAGLCVRDVCYDVLSILADLLIEFVVVWKGFLNLNFAGWSLNFENFVDFAALRNPPQRDRPLGLVLVFPVIAVGLWVDCALIWVHQVGLLFKNIYLTV